MIQSYTKGLVGKCKQTKRQVAWDINMFQLLMARPFPVKLH